MGLKMKSLSGVFFSSAVGALLVGLGPVVPSAMAADADLPVKAPPVVVAELPWWTHGFIEFGGRGFLNDPPRDGHIWQGQGSLAKYYEYSANKPGPFGDFFATAGTRDGLYEIDAWGVNPGYRDQAYDAYWTKAGQQYLDFHYDETPHVYSTSASTLFTGIGTNTLTLANPSIGQQIFAAGTGAGVANAFPSGSGAGAAATASLNKGAAIAPIINQNLHQTDIGIKRQTGSVDYRYTPTDNWDIRANYAYLERTGTQVDSVIFSPSTTASRVDVPKPVHDNTQTFGVNGEYIGTSAWGQKFNAIVGYNGSYYNDDLAGYTVQNPFCNAAGLCAGAQPTAPLALMSLPPSNHADGVTGTVGADLPLNSRYMGTISYTGMWQNQQFLPFSINPVVIPGVGVANNLASLPAQNLNGQINTLLVNNVVTTQITPDLKTKFGYRYYSYDNETPQLTILNWALTDATGAKGVTNNYAPVNPLNVAYNRQDGVAEATWRPVNSVNLGAAYNFERYDFTRFDATSTTENSGKVYADWKPAIWTTVRASASYGERRAGNYDYLNNVGIFQWPVAAPSATNPVGFPNSTQYSPFYRQFYLDDRDRATARFQVDVDVIKGLTVTPTFIWRDDEFLLQQNQLGLTHDRSTAAGIEAGYSVTSSLQLLFSYMNEQRNQFEYGSGTTLAPYTTNLAYTCPAPAAPSIFSTCQLYSSNIQDRMNTFIIGANYAVIPQRLELGLNYTDAYGKVSSPLIQQNGSGPPITMLTTAGNSTIPAVQFPDVTTHFQRLEAKAKYVIDPDYTRSLGIVGNVSVKFRYAWERNNVTNWNNDLTMPYMFTVFPQTNTLYYQSMAWNNPNYNVHLFGASVAWAW